MKFDEKYETTYDLYQYSVVCTTYMVPVYRYRLTVLMLNFLPIAGGGPNSFGQAPVWPSSHNAV